MTEESSYPCWVLASLVKVALVLLDTAENMLLSDLDNRGGCVSRGGYVATVLHDALADPRTIRRLRIPGAVTRFGLRAAAHVQATAARLSGSLLTMAGLGCIDVGAFEAHPIAGWITTGVTVLLLDWKLEPPAGDR